MRKCCTKKNPYSPNRHKSGDFWAHKEAQEVPNSQEDGWPSGDIVTMKCLVCGITWKKELPQ